MNLSRLSSKPWSWWLQTPLYAGRIVARRLNLDERIFSICKPPSPSEKQLIQQLRSNFPFEEKTTDEGMPAASREWKQNNQKLRSMVMEMDPRGFLRWDVVGKTMFAGNEPYISTELDFLRGLPQWKERWDPLIKEDKIGRPTLSPLYPQTSANRIHHAYHIARFENAMGNTIDKFDAVVEYGAGYGSFRRLWGVLAPQARYFLFDFPEWNALQKYYLSHFDFPATSVFSSESARAQAFVAGAKCPLFVAMWSLSESSLRDREWVEATLDSFSGVLIAFQTGFGDVDNVKYFQNWVERFPSFAWTTTPITHLPGHFYLVGHRAT